MSAVYENIIALLNTDTGNLAYHLVLSFSLARLQARSAGPTLRGSCDS